MRVLKTQEDDALIVLWHVLQSLSAYIHLPLMPAKFLEILFYSSLNPKSPDVKQPTTDKWLFSESSHCLRLQGSNLKMYEDLRRQPIYCLHTYSSLLSIGRTPRFFLSQKTVPAKVSKNIASRLASIFQQADPMCILSSGHSMSRGEKGASLKNQQQMLETSQSLALGQNT